VFKHDAGCFDGGAMKQPPTIQLPKEFAEFAADFACDPVALAYRVLRQFAGKRRRHLVIKRRP
jgi:hypothetical protein